MLFTDVLVSYDIVKLQTSTSSLLELDYPFLLISALEDVYINFGAI